MTPKASISCFSAFVLMSFLTSGCASLQRPGEWKKLKSSEQFRAEKEEFHKRIGGKSVCLGVGVAEFTYRQDIQPSSSCIYPAVMYARINDDRYWVNSLKVLQVQRDGFLVTGNSFNSQNVYIHKTDEVGVVDNTFLANSPNDYIFYEYVGPFSYQSMMGTRTIHSFRKVKQGMLGEAQRDFKSYHFLHEVFSDLELWDWADVWKEMIGKTK